MKGLIRKGKVKHFGMSEAAAKTSVGRTRSSRSGRCRASTRCGGDGPRKRCCRPAINSASACPGQCRCWVRRQPIGPAHINLTTVSQNTQQQQAEHAVAAAVERLDEQCSAPREVVLSPRLAIRRTAASTPLVWLITPREIAVGGSGQLT